MLHVTATPIGNLGDLSPRALDAFRNASLIACEDTRRTWQLLSHFGIPRPEMVSYRQGNEERVSRTVIDAVKAGREVVLCSDGGYPGISDPGYRLVRECAREGVPYEIIPGACAVETALLMSGLSTSSYTRPRGDQELVRGRQGQGAYARLLRVAVSRRRDARGRVRRARRPRGCGVHRAHETPRARQQGLSLRSRERIRGRQGEGRGRDSHRRLQPEIRPSAGKYGRIGRCFSK